MAGVRVHFIFSKELLDRVDAVRGDLSRGAWVRGLVERELEWKPVPLRHEPLLNQALSRVEEFRRASQR